MLLLALAISHAKSAGSASNGATTTTTAAKQVLVGKKSSRS